MQTPFSCPPAARPIALGASLALALLCPQAQAHSDRHNFAYDNCDLVGSPIVTVQMPGYFKKNSQQYDFLSEWENIEHSPGWTCIRYGHVKKRPDTTWLPGGIKLSNMPEHLAAQFIADDGKNYTVYTADPAGQIGYIMRQKLVIVQSGNTLQHDWRPVTLHNQNEWAPWFNITQGNQERYEVVVKNQIRLLKWGQGKTFPGSGSSFLFRAVSFLYLTEVEDSNGKSEVPAEYPPPQSRLDRAPRHSYVNVRLERADKTCRTTPSDQTVRLPTIARDSLQGKGSTAGKTAFALKLDNCDADINHIYYTLLPSVNGSAKNGILPPSAKSTATGVNIQILDADGDPVQLGAEGKNLVNGYQTGAVNARIRLYAQYIQTAQTVIPGKVLASMIVTYIYK